MGYSDEPRPQRVISQLHSEQLPELFKQQCSAPNPLPSVPYKHRTLSENDVLSPLQLMEPQTADIDLASINYERYDPNHEVTQLEAIRSMISTDLSEPYSIYVYRYFLYQWGDLCYMALDQGELVGVVVGKLEVHRGGPLRGYIAMLAVKESYRGNGIATKLVQLAINAMKSQDADEVALETEVTNTAAIKLYERLGFLRSKQLHRYYFNGNSAFRLILYLKPSTSSICCAEEHNHDHDHDDEVDDYIS